MSNGKTSKKITRVDGGGTESKSTTTGTFSVGDEAKAKAKKLRLIAILCFVAAIGFEIGAIMVLRKVPINTTWLVVLIIADLIFAVAGSLLWKKSNRLDPASEKDTVRFFIQNQLGLIIAAIAFLPLVILIFSNKDLSGKQKGIVGGIAVVAMLVAGMFGVDMNPPSLEQYEEQTKKVQELTDGNDHVYWTKSGKSYHLYSDCGYINSDRTTEIFEGTTAQSRELKNITDLCDRCGKRAVKEKENLPVELEETDVVTE